MQSQFKENLDIRRFCCLHSEMPQASANLEVPRQRSFRKYSLWNSVTYKFKGTGDKQDEAMFRYVLCGAPRCHRDINQSGTGLHSGQIQINDIFSYLTHHEMQQGPSNWLAVSYLFGLHPGRIYCFSRYSWAGIQTSRMPVPKSLEEIMYI